jgi:hypothetical protein
MTTHVADFVLADVALAVDLTLMLADVDHAVL